jgi:hypothetical protein
MSENHGGVEPPKTDEMMSDENERDADPMVEQAVQQATQFHQLIDGAKEWSRETSAELRVKAALADSDEETEELEQIAGMVRSVNQRIERGDTNLARQP